MTWVLTVQLLPKQFQMQQSGCLLSRLSFHSPRIIDFILHKTSDVRYPAMARLDSLRVTSRKKGTNQGLICLFMTVYDCSNLLVLGYCSINNFNIIQWCCPWLSMFVFICLSFNKDWKSCNGKPFEGSNPSLSAPRGRQVTPKAWKKLELQAPPNLGVAAEDDLFSQSEPE